MPSRVDLARRALRLYPFLSGRWRIASLAVAGSASAWDDASERVHATLPAGEIIRCRNGISIRIERERTYVDPYLFGDYEAAHSRALTRLLAPGQTALDVGANFGWFTALFARAVGPAGAVHAFEPVPALAELAAETIRLNEIEAAVTLNPLALGSEVGRLTINTFAGLPRAHASHASLGRDDAEPHECVETTLDRYVEEAGLGRVALVKIDVEGHELEVLRGGRATLTRADAPIVSFEVNRPCLLDQGAAPEDLQDLLRSYGYTELWLVSRKGGRRVLELVRDQDATYLAAKRSSGDLARAFH